jgi:uncharacterized protein
MPIDFDTLWTLATRQFALGDHSIHGPSHWRRVESNALWLAERSGADVVVVRLFAVLHDSCRENDGRDREHGLRASEFAKTLRDPFLPISEEQFDLLTYALIHHDRGQVSADATIGTCWDADRLDLTRCHMTPHPRFMSTEAGRIKAGGISVSIS